MDIINDKNKYKNIEKIIEENINLNNVNSKEIQREKIKDLISQKKRIRFIKKNDL